MGEIDSLIKSLEVAKEKLTDAIRANQKPVSAPSLITRISVFQTPEEAKLMRFYTKEEWDNLSEKDKKAYNDKKKERDLVIESTRMQDAINNAVDRISS